MLSTKSGGTTEDATTKQTKLKLNIIVRVCPFFPHLGVVFHLANEEAYHGHRHGDVYNPNNHNIIF